jgi:hypothetical protein
MSLSNLDVTANGKASAVPKHRVPDELYCHVLVTRFGLIIGFTERLHLVTTNNFNTFTYLHTLQITIANSKSSMFSLVVAW